MDKFLEFMSDKKDFNKVNLEVLKEQIKKIGIRKTDQAQACIANMPTNVRIALDNISKWLKDNKMQIADFHKSLDKNKDGVVVMSEWTNQMKNFRIPSINESELNLIFENLDVNNDGELSLNELSLFIKGVELSKG